MVTGIIEIQTIGINGIGIFWPKKLMGYRILIKDTYLKEKGFNPRRAHFNISFS